MIDLCISGSLSRDILVFTIDSESKTVDQFSKSIHFFLEDNRTYRIYFEQKSEQYIPRCAEVVLNLLFLPIRGFFNIITFNADQNWEKDISAFKVSGYIDVNLNENTKISFELKHGWFDKNQMSFCKSIIVFASDSPTNQMLTSDSREISEKHTNYLFNIASVSMFFYALFIFLLIVSNKYNLNVAFIIVSSIIVLFSVLIGFIVKHSFKKKKRLLAILSKQSIDE